LLMNPKPLSVRRLIVPSAIVVSPSKLPVARRAKEINPVRSPTNSLVCPGSRRLSSDHSTNCRMTWTDLARKHRSAAGVLRAAERRRGEGLSDGLGPGAMVTI
jgi:hypothetical protein